MKLSRMTYANVKKCNWCGNIGEYKMVKVSPKKEKPACLRCADLFKPQEITIPEKDN